MANNLRDLGGCQPLPLSGTQPVRSAISEFGRDALSPEDYRGIAIPMFVKLGNTVGATTGSFTYRVPTSHNLIIEGVAGLLALVDLAHEVKTITYNAGANGLGDFSSSPDVTSRSLFKAMNAQLKLQNNDRTQVLIDGNQLPLAMILAIAGGRPIDWSDKPHVVPAGETLQLDVTLTQTDTTTVGGDTLYGVLLSGHIVRAKST